VKDHTESRLPLQRGPRSTEAWRRLYELQATNARGAGP
jgi:hypothetical protein